MNIHECQAKEILASFGVAVPRGKVAKTPAEAEEIAADGSSSSGDRRGWRVLFSGDPVPRGRGVPYCRADSRCDTKMDGV